MGLLILVQVGMTMRKCCCVIVASRVTRYIPVASLPIGPMYQKPGHSCSPCPGGKQGQVDDPATCRQKVKAALKCLRLLLQAITEKPLKRNKYYLT